MSLPLERGYAAVEGHYDEMALDTGELRPHWRELMAALESLGSAELPRRWQEGQRLIQEHGVTYNVYGDPRGTARPWQLDAIPLLISPGEWRSIEAAVAQRATLLDRVLADLYGERRLLREGRLPPELVFANPGFLRPCHGIPVPGDVFLHAYAADLARSPDGQWWVIGDRTQAPSGAGYALENRVVLSRILPEMFRPFHVHRLAGFFQSYRDTLMRLAPARRGEPRVVLLTPGPYNETYFEHSYLARYLGLTLVEGADLTVREDRVFLKTLSGLLQVDVIVRRLDDDFCDPLELRGESTLGVPGLVQALRSGNVAVVNALGSSLLETAASMAFLPGLCRQLLGEELRMPSVATWWCGQEREREYVIDHMDEIVVKSTFPSAQREVIFGAQLSKAQRRALADRIRAQPHEFVAQEQVALSTVPTGAEDGPSPRHLVLRVYAVRHGDGYSVMPGGLTRVSTSRDSLVVTSQGGGSSKDTWVISPEPVPYISLMDRSSRPAEVSRGSFVLTSRIADNLLWLGRACERVEAGVRLFRLALRRMAEEPIRAADAPPPDAVELLQRMGHAADAEDAGEPLETRVLDALFDRQRPGSPGTQVRWLREMAWLARDRMSADAWRVLANLEQEFVAPRGHPALRVNAAIELLDRSVLALAGFVGLVLESMTRGMGWAFLEVGRRVERGIQMTALLDHGLVAVSSREQRRLENLLEVADSSMTYRSRYLTSVQLPLLLDLLLLDEANPHSVAFQLAQLETRFQALPRMPSEGIRRVRSRLADTRVEELARIDDGGDPPHRPALGALLEEVGQALPAAADALNHAYLSHAIPRRRPPSVGGARP